MQRLRPFLLVLILLFVHGAAATQAAEMTCAGKPGPVRLFVTVEGVRASQGLIAITVYPDDSRRFLAHHGSLYVARVPAVAPLTRSCVRLPATGTYALAVYHDANANRHLDRSALGLPKEGFGFSNNPSTFFGLPSFHSVRLQVARADLETRIRLRYP